MKTKLVAIVGLAALAVSGTVSAQEAGNGRPDRERGPRMMERIDTDGSGSISAAEWSAVARGIGPIAEADGDGDGVLTVEEITAAMERQRAERRARMIERRYDIDGDGEITVDELTEHKQEQFALLDRDNDGTVTVEELRRSPWARGGRQGRGHGWHGR